MFQVLNELRQRYANDWLFALGCFHPSRILGLKQLNVWADYKGWIFQYEKRNETLTTYLESLGKNHLSHTRTLQKNEYILELQKLIKLRKDKVKQKEKIEQQLFKKRRTLRGELVSVYQKLKRMKVPIASRFKNLLTHGLLDKGEIKLVKSALRILDKEGSEYADNFVENIRANHKLKKRIGNVERQIDQINVELGERVTEFTRRGPRLSKDIKQFCNNIVSVIRRSECEQRFEHTRDNIVERVLLPLKI